MGTIITSLITLAVVGVVIYIVMKFLPSAAAAVTGGNTSIAIETTIVDGKKEMDSNVSIPLSKNEDEGIEFSYTTWIKIDDFTYRYGQQRVIFTKGPTDLSSMCPALVIDNNSNALLVKVDTYGITEVVSVGNIPAKKWIHVGIVVTQTAIEVYINGTLHTHHSIAQIPRQNTGAVHTSVGGGFEGKLGSLTYYNYALQPSDISSLAQTPPQADPNDIGGPTPPYFAPSWWIGRR